jgi:hypothetical protein
VLWGWLVAMLAPPQGVRDKMWAARGALHTEV